MSASSKSTAIREVVQSRLTELSGSILLRLRCGAPLEYLREWLEWRRPKQISHN